MIDVAPFCEALRQARLIDLSQTYQEHMPNFPTHSKFHHNLWGSYWHGDRALTYQLVMNETTARTWTLLRTSSATPNPTPT